MSGIIVVDNDAAMHEIFTIIFENEYEIQCLSEGSLILTGAIKAPGLFVLDRQLPSAEGLELCRFIKNSPQYQTVPVLLLSAWPNSGESAAEAGADYVIAKPFCLDQLKNHHPPAFKSCQPLRILESHFFGEWLTNYSFFNPSIRGFIKVSEGKVKKKKCYQSMEKKIRYLHGWSSGFQLKDNFYIAAGN